MQRWFEAWRRFRRERAGARAFRALPRARRRIVFYTEGPGYWSHFEPVFRSLRDDYGEQVLYVTSAENDPLLVSPPPGLVPFYIGSGTVRTLFFAGLDADVVLMTMPDLQTYHIKRSPHGVHYVYLHHSLVSTHMVYRPAAFDHFDSMLCAGPHHVAETRVREKLQGLPAKTLVEHGYGRLDAILARGRAGPPARAADAPPEVLVAPSWGDQGLIEQHGDRVMEPLLAAGFRVTLRPHPRTRQFHGRVLDAIAARHAQHDNFRLDEDISGHDSLLAADLMVSDWSGAALEFAFGLERPVLFVDVPRKVQNPDYAALGIEPLEAQIRETLGEIVSADDLATLGRRAQALLAQAPEWQARIREARCQHVFNPGASGRVAADYLVSLTRGTPDSG